MGGRQTSSSIYPPLFSSDRKEKKRKEGGGVSGKNKNKKIKWLSLHPPQTQSNFHSKRRKS
jgi:hypothetical protein